VLEDHRATGVDTAAIVDLFGRHGVIASPRPPHHVRLVTHRHHDDATIDEALARIADGTYGICATCGREIGEERLEALPWATLCIDDARKQAR